MSCNIGTVVHDMEPSGIVAALSAAISPQAFDLCDAIVDDRHLSLVERARSYLLLHIRAAIKQYVFGLNMTAFGIWQHQHRHRQQQQPPHGTPASLVWLIY